MSKPKTTIPNAILQVVRHFPYADGLTSRDLSRFVDAIRGCSSSPESVMRTARRMEERGQLKIHSKHRGPKPSTFWFETTTPEFTRLRVV